MSDLDITKASNVVSITGADATGLETNMVNADSAGNLNVVVNNLPANPVPISGVINNAADQTSGFYPDPSSYNTGVQSSFRVDSDNNLITRSDVHTDAGSFRDDFSGSSLGHTVTGTATFVNGSTDVVGVGTLFTSEVQIKNYIKLSSHASTDFARIASINSDTSITLQSPYTGANGSGNFDLQHWKNELGNNGTISVSNSELNLISGTTNGGYARVTRYVDYCPLLMYSDLSISQRINNQIAYVGFIDNPDDIQKQVTIVFDGNNPNYVKFRTSVSSAANETEETIIQLSGGQNTSQLLDYQIEISSTKCILSIEHTIVATHTDHIPGPYDTLSVGFSISNSAAVTSTTLKCSVIGVSNTEQLQVLNAYTGHPLNVSIVNSKNINTLNHTAYYPNPNDSEDGEVPIQSEPGGALRTRSVVLTDEGSFRDDFSGTSNTFNLTGTVSFFNGSDRVSGIGSLFSTELSSNYYIKLSTDTDSYYSAIDQIISDEELILVSPYLGSTGTGTGVSAKWKPTIVGGATISVLNSLATLASSTANNNSAILFRDGDYGPFLLEASLDISQRVANQTTVFGFVSDTTPTPTRQAVVIFDGTSDRTIKFQTSSSTSASDTQTTTITLSNNGVTSTTHLYTIEVSKRNCTLLIDTEVVATHTIHIPDVYGTMGIIAKITNSAIVTNTNFNINAITFDNANRIAIKNHFSSSPAKVQVMGKSITTGLNQDLILDNNGNLIVTALTGFGANFTFGDISTAATTEVVVRRTAYTEQSTNAQRSIASANANDTAAGTGARTVTITYYDQTGAGPYTETLTLSGTTGVNTANSNICFIEKMQVTTVGSGTNNAGIITLYSAINKGGSAIGTIAATDNQTYWSHHYVPINKTINITGISCSHNGTTVGSGAGFRMYSIGLPVANQAILQVSDTVRLYGQSSTFSRVYQSPIKITGPARLELRVSPETTSSVIYRGSFDYFEPQ